MKVDNCWANIDKKEGGLNSKVNICFDENDTGANRSVKIRVSSRDGSVSEECTLVHKKKEQVVYRNKRQSALFTKEGCNSETEKGEELEYVVEAGKYTSIISQSDADDKAMKDIEQNGQNWVNEHGRCITVLWYNVKKSKSFRKNDCDPDTEEGSLVTMTIEAGQFSSTISQEDADRKAEAELNAKGQDYANSHGTCNTIKWYNDRKSKMFQKTDCEVTEVGSMVEYVVEAGRFSSSVSKEDANQKALEALEAEGPGYANEHGTCETNLWYNVEKSKVFYKNDCEDGFIGAPYTYTVEAGKYTSDVSQEDADQKALDDIEKNGQDQANLNGECVTDPNYFVGKASARVQKNDCDAESQTGSFVDLTEKDLAGYPDAFVSRESQEAANALAQAAMEEQKQDLANKKGTCIDKNQFVGVYSKVFTKDNCDGEGVGSQVTVDQDDVIGGPFTSYESQEAANALAQAAVEQQGQAIANRDGHCTWTGKYSEEFTKNDCNEGQVGSKITVTEQDVVGAPFTSTVSQDDANNKAKAAVKEQGQAIANSKGNCENMTVYTGHYSKRFVPECEACHKGVEMEVTAEMVNGSPVTSTESQDAADAEARRIVEEGGQAYANKNGNCTPLSTDPVWEDVEPEELRCNEGKSQKKQHDTNECSETHNQERWVDGGDKVCTWTGTYSKQFTKQCADGGVGSEVTIDQDDVTGGPFTSTVSQEDANSKAQAAVEAQGQALADAQGTCTWTGKASKVFTRNNCGSCQHGSSVTVTQDEVGGPFTSNISQADANKKAQDAVNSQGQAVANKNADCLPDSTTPSWSDTGSTRCDGCTSQKQQRDTNPCSSSYNDTRWVNGGGESCTDWSYYGTGDCVGHTRYNAYRDSCSGSIDRQYSVSCRNCCNCGSYGSWQENGCNGTKTKFIRYDDCGNSDTKEEHIIGSCGYALYEFQFHDGRTSKSRSVTGESQDIEEVIISTKNDSYIGCSVKSKPSWCSVDYRDQTSGSMKAVVTLSANTTSSSRSGDIVFVQNESGKTVTLSITQDVAVTYEFSTNQSTWNADANGGANNSYLCIQLKSKKNGSKIGYAVSSKPSWVTEVTEKPSGVSCPVLSGYDYSFVIIITANSSSSSRSGTVTLKQNESGKTVNITVNQEGKAEAKPVPAHITLKNGSWATYRKDNVSYDPGAGKCIAGFEWAGDEKGNIRIYTCDIKVVDANYREISGATISIGTTTQRRQSGSSCSYFGAVNGGILAGYVHSGDENGYTTWYIRTINVSYEGKVYKTATVRQYEKQNISKKGGVFNVYNESPASYNFIVDGAECGDENGTLKYAYSQMDLNPA